MTITPFGLAHGSHHLDNSPEQAYLYGGKEIQEELNLGWMDYGARMYSPEVGRWSAVDPKSEKYIGYSSYAYVNNSPILFKDPNGEEIWIMYGDNQRIKYANGKLYNADGSKYCWQR
jgi:RHS repeat-associated protein